MSRLERQPVGPKVETLNPGDLDTCGLGVAGGAGFGAQARRSGLQTNGAMGANTGVIGSKPLANPNMCPLRTCGLGVAGGVAGAAGVGTGPAVLMGANTGALNTPGGSVGCSVASGANRFLMSVYVGATAIAWRASHAHVRACGFDEEECVASGREVPVPA